MGNSLAQYSTHYYAQTISIQIHQYLSEVCSSDVNENVFGVQRDTGVLTCGMKRIKDQIDDGLHVAWQHTNQFSPMICVINNPKVRIPYSAYILMRT